jgi:hypothetical protein
MNRLHKTYRKQAADALREYRSYKRLNQDYARANLHFGKYIAFKSAAWNLKFELTLKTSAA